MGNWGTTKFREDIEMETFTSVLVKWRRARQRKVERIEGRERDRERQREKVFKNT